MAYVLCSVSAGSLSQVYGVSELDTNAKVHTLFHKYGAGYIQNSSITHAHDFYDRKYRPREITEEDFELDSDLKARCTPPGDHEPVFQCMYDARTISVQMGEETRRSKVDFLRTKQLLSKYTVPRHFKLFRLKIAVEKRQRVGPIILVIFTYNYSINTYNFHIHSPSFTI